MGRGKLPLVIGLNSLNFYIQELEIQIFAFLAAGMAFARVKSGQIEGLAKGKW